MKFTAKGTSVVRYSTTSKVNITSENHGKVLISIKSLKRVLALIRDSHLVSTLNVVLYRIKDAPLSCNAELLSGEIVPWCVVPHCDRLKVLQRS
jgi:hypothetical protein